MIKDMDFFRNHARDVVAAYSYRLGLDKHPGSMVRMRNGNYYQSRLSPDAFLDELGCGFWVPVEQCRRLTATLGSGQPVALMLDRDTMALAVKTPWNDKNRNIGYVILRGMEIYHAVDCKEAETDLGLLSMDPDVTGGNGMQSSGNACWIPTGMSIRSLRDHLKRARELYRKYMLAYRERLGM